MISPLVYKLMCLPSPGKEFHNKVKKVNTNFIWEGKPSRIAYHKIFQNYDVGGLRLSDLKTRNLSLKTTWVRCIFDYDGEAFWPIFAYENLPIKNELIWFCNITSNDVYRNF